MPAKGWASCAPRVAGCGRETRPSARTKANPGDFISPPSGSLRANLLDCPHDDQELDRGWAHHRVAGVDHSRPPQRCADDYGVDSDLQQTDEDLRGNAEHPARGQAPVRLEELF